MKLEDSTLLIVDDNEDNLRMLSLRLTRRGYGVEIASSGKQALALLDQRKFDLVLLDIMMPEMDGFEVLEVIRKTQSITDLPVIMATAKDESEDVIKALKLGANDYVTKPIDFPVLMARVQTQLTGRNLAQLKDEFLRIASHDLKNPLWSITTAAQMVSEMTPVGAVMTEQAAKIFSMIERQAQQMQLIIADFLDFQAAQDGQLKLISGSVDMNEVARRAVETNRDYAARKGLTLQLQLDESLDLIKGDEARLSQVAQNFVSNAIKFSPKQGGLTLVRTLQQGDHLRLEVQDSGPGLTDEDLNRVFTKYARLSNRPTGGEKSSGLGLAICKQMIELHNGQVGVHNNPERGATFWFSVPALPITIV